MTGGMAGGGGGMGGGYDGGAHMAGGGGGGGGGFAGGAGMGGGYAGGAHMAGGSVGDAHMSGGAHMGGAGMGGGYVGGAHMAGGSHMGCAGPMAATGCMDGGYATGCMGEVTTSGSLTYVGASRGDWVTETTYKYVGGGAGDLAMLVTNKRSYLPCAIIGLLLVAVVAVALLCLQTPTTTAPVIVKDRFISTTRAPVMPPPPPPPQRKTCLFWGDPHLVTFDGARPSFYGDGEYWIVNSGPVQIQGRYMGTKYTYGLAATQKVVVAGTFLNGHKIEVEPVERAYGGRILVDGQPVLAEFGILKVCEGATITYDGQGELPDKAASLWTSRIVHMELPMGISFTVYRWGNYLDLKLEMTPVPGGQDGSCGNFNGDPSDDTTPQIFERIGVRVADGELLFNSRSADAWSFEEAEMLKTCDSQTYADAQNKCKEEIKGAQTTIMLHECMFDLCFGMNEHALRTARTFASAKDKAAAGEMSETA